MANPMKTQSADTSVDAEQFLIERLRALPPWRKLEQVSQMTETLRQLSLMGLQMRYPSASPEELHRRLAALWLGRKWSRRLYGWDPEIEGY